MSKTSRDFPLAGACCFGNLPVASDEERVDIGLGWPGTEPSFLLVVTDHDHAVSIDFTTQGKSDMGFMRGLDDHFLQAQQKTTIIIFIALFFKEYHCKNRMSH